MVAENLDVFTANGFKIETDLAAPAGRRTRLTAVPFSKGVQFGVDDVRELASLLSDEFDSTEFRTDLTMRHSDSYSTSKRAVMRLPKLLSMFASRACRQAVMIGTHLSEREMVGIVQQLVHIEQPWNCPHGRPTMRHLADLATLRYNRDQEMLSQLM